jgi:hypothetical protein
MATYGASIPAKVYRQLGYDVYTRHRLAHVLARALDYVGMRFLDALAPYNILDPSNAELNDPSHTVSTRAAIFLFDFPSTETFGLRFAGEGSDRAYRPVFVLSLGGAQDATTAVSVNGAIISFQVGFRPDVVNFGLSDIVTFNSLRNSPTNFNGLSDGAYTSGNIADLGRYFSMPSLANWRPHSGGSFTTTTSTLQVRHINVYLGPGGLMLCGGTNDQTQDKNGLFDLWNFWCFFGGERIPNRQKLPINDPELTRICPVIPCYGKTGANPGTADATWRISATYSPVGTAAPQLLAVQTGARNSLADGQSAQAGLYALDLLDFRFASLSSFPTVVSPTIVANAPRNLLSPVIVRPLNGFETVGPGTTGKYYPVTDDGVYDLQTWEHLYYAANFRTSDASLSMGEVTDPDTGIKWWGHWWNDWTCACAFRLGASYDITGTLPTKSYGTATVHTWDFSGVSVVDGVNIPAGAGIPSITNVDFFFSSGSVGAWAQVASQDYFESSITTATASQPSMDFVIDWPAGVDQRRQIEVSFSAFLRGGQENNAAHTLTVEVESVYHNASTFLTIFTMQASGANAGNPSHNYTNRGTFRIPVGALGRDGKIRFRVRHIRTSTAGTNPETARFGGLSLSFRQWQ